MLGDLHGDVQHLGERDCSLQRRHQKLVEVAPSPALDPALRERVLQAALVLTRAARYESLGTVEFLVSGDELFFLEANPRVQVEHTVTEEVTGVDLVRAQLRVAAGASLADLGLAEPPVVRGVAVQARVNLESLAADGTPLPASGVMTAFAPPAGPGVRVDTCGYPGYRVSPRYDSLVAKVVCRGDDFAAAVARLDGALGEFRLEGVASNLDLLQAITRDADFTAGRWDTGFLDSHLPALLEHVRATTVTAGGPEQQAAARVEVPEGAVAVTASMAGVVVSVDAQPGAVVGRRRHRRGARGDEDGARRPGGRAGAGRRRPGVPRRHGGRRRGAGVRHAGRRRRGGAGRRPAGRGLVGRGGRDRAPPGRRHGDGRAGQGGPPARDRAAHRAGADHRPRRPGHLLRDRRPDGAARPGRPAGRRPTSSPAQRGSTGAR